MYETIVDNWKKYVKTYEAHMKMMTRFILLYAYHSSKIENHAITFEDTKAIFDSSKIVQFSGDLKTIFEIKNNKDGIDLMFEMLKIKEPIDLEMIKRFHYRLTKYTYDERRFNINAERPGEFKNRDYITNLHNVGSAPEDVERDIKTLLAEINNNVEAENTLHEAAYFHAKFENIHPFADGNGDVGRILTDYLLLLRHHPPIVFFETEKKEYIEALRQFDVGGDLELMEDYIKEQTVKTWNRRKKLTGEA